MLKNSKIVKKNYKVKNFRIQKIQEFQKNLKSETFQKNLKFRKFQTILNTFEIHNFNNLENSKISKILKNCSIEISQIKNGPRIIYRHMYHCLNYYNPIYK